MDTTIANLSPHELEKLLTTVIDGRMQVWLTQLLDAVGDMREEDEAELQAAFETSLRSALFQAKGGDVMTLDNFRRQLLDE